jgi:predicted TIM-barrel fold metal-dependent hydrolase
MGRVLQLFVAYAVASLLITEVTVAQGVPIIDVHLHGGYNRFVLDADGNPLRRPCRPVPCERAPAQIQSGEEILPRTLDIMKKHNIVLGIVSDAPPLPRDERWVFDDWAAADSNRFIFGYLISHPTDIALDDLRELLESGEIQVMGELAFQYNEIAIDDPILEPFFALAEELDVPVHIHLGGNGRGDTFPIYLGNPLTLSKVMRKHPTLRVYVENASFPFLEEIVAVVMRYPNVYVDVSTALWAYPRRAIHTHLRGLVELGLSKRIMFGSDQNMWPETIEIAIETIETADFLTEEEKHDIFYNNAARFLRLSDEEIARHHGR